MIRDDLLDVFEPLMTQELSEFLDAIAVMFDEAELYALAEVEDDGWKILFDPDRCPAKALPHLAMYVGEHFLPGLTELEQREWIKDQANSYRGNEAAVAYAMQRALTGERTVAIRRRYPNADGVWIITLPHETPSTRAVYDVLDKVFPLDLDLIYQVGVGGMQNWEQLASQFSSWAGVKAFYADWSDLRGSDPAWLSVANAYATWSALAAAQATWLDTYAGSVLDGFNVYTRTKVR